MIRLAGLYHSTRGPHTFFAKKGTVERWGGRTINLLHYEDAANLVLKVLLGAGCEEGRLYRSATFLAVDDKPITLEDMMSVALSSSICSGTVEFVGDESAGKGKIMENQITRSRLGEQWQLRYPTFSDMANDGGRDWYSTCGLF